MADSEADSEALSTQADEDSRLKYLGNTRDARYTERSLLLRFHTTERGERRLLLLNLRKGYLKQGEWFGTKVYLSRAPAAAPTRTPPPSPPRRLPPHTAAPPLVPSGTASTPPSHAALPRCPPTPRRRRGAERGSRRARGGRGGGHRGVFTRRGGIDLLHALPRQQSQLWEACSGVYAAAAKQARGAAVGGAPLALPALSLPAGRRGRGRAAVHTDGLLSAAPLGAAIRSEHDLAGEPHTPPHTSYRAVAHLPIGRSRARPLAAQVSRLDFASSDEREHFLSFVQALLPPSA